MFKKSGFTLIELLIAIAIIAVLIAVSLVSYERLKQNARDGQRKTDLKSIQSALEQYYRDNTVYPSSADGLGVLSSGSNKYIKQVPEEAADTVFPYAYIPLYVSATFANSTGCDNSTTNKCAKYCLFAKVENTSNARLDSNCPNTLPGSGNYDYSVSSP